MGVFIGVLQGGIITRNSRIGRFPPIRIPWTLFLQNRNINNIYIYIYVSKFVRNTEPSSP